MNVNTVFMPDKGTWNAVFTLKNLGQRAIEMKKDLFLCFIDYKKAFDKVKHNKMIKLELVIKTSG